MVNLIKRFFAAASLSALIVATILVWSVYQNRDEGMSVANALRGLGAIVLLAVAFIGTRLRHAGTRDDRREGASVPRR